MKVCIVCEYAGSKELGMNYRPYYLAKEFVKQGHEVCIISASYSHDRSYNPDLNGKKYKIQMFEGIKYIFLKSLKYQGSTDKKRVLKWFHFAYKILSVKKLIDKQDVVICSTPGLIQALGAYYLAREFKAKFVFEVRDIWPLSLVELGGFSSKHPFVKFLSWIERFAIKKSDLIVSNLPSYNKHLENLGFSKPFTWISNGIDLDEVRDKNPLKQSVIEQILKDKFIVGYTGAIGEANAVEYFLESAKFLNENICLVVVGSGKNNKKARQSFAGKSNIIFVDKIPKNQIQSMLSLFDVCYIGLKQRKLFTYGISPTKLYDYMYSAKPIIYAIESGEVNLVKLANCGICTQAEEPKKIANAINKMQEMPESERQILGQNGKAFVVNDFSYQDLAKKYIQAIKNLG